MGVRFAAVDIFLPSEACLKLIVENFPRSARHKSSSLVKVAGKDLDSRPMMNSIYLRLDQTSRNWNTA